MTSWGMGLGWKMKWKEEEDVTWCTLRHLPQKEISASSTPRFDGSFLTWNSKQVHKKAIWSTYSISSYSFLSTNFSGPEVMMKIEVVSAIHILPWESNPGCEVSQDETLVQIKNQEDDRERREREKKKWKEIRWDFARIKIWSAGMDLDSLRFFFLQSVFLFVFKRRRIRYCRLLTPL